MRFLHFVAVIFNCFYGWKMGLEPLFLICCISISYNASSLLRSLFSSECLTPQCIPILHRQRYDKFFIFPNIIFIMPDKTFLKIKT